MSAHAIQCQLPDEHEAKMWALGSLDALMSAAIDCMDSIDNMERLDRSQRLMDLGRDMVRAWMEAAEARAYADLRAARPAHADNPGMTARCTAEPLASTALQEGGAP